MMNLLKHWFRGTTTPQRRRASRVVQTEELETRILLTIDVIFDYTYDTNGFFSDAERRITLEAAGRLFEDAFSDSLSAITPGGSNTWTDTSDNPQTGVHLNLVNRTIPANQVIIFVGARNLIGIGQASAGFSAGGSAAWFDTLEYRGQTVNPNTETSTRGGSVAFDSLNTWHFGLTDVGLDNAESDFYSTAIHEIAHLFGISSGSDSWVNNISGGTFNGPNVNALTGGAGAPASGGHFADNTMSDGREVSMSPVGTSGTRSPFTSLDWAAMDDIGWTLTFDEASIGNKPGHLVVHVTDATGAPLVGQSVTLSGSGTANTPTGTTDANGLFSTFVTGGTWTATVNGTSEIVMVNGGMEVAEITPSATTTQDDIIIYDAGTGRWRAGVNNGTSFTWIDGAKWNPAAGWQTFTGDVNGDGYTDGIGFNSSNQIFFAVNDGAGNLISTPGGSFSPTVTFQHLLVGDFDGNGTDDFLAQQATSNGGGLSGQWFSRRWNGASFETAFFGRWSPSFIEFAAGDFNGDGADDIVGLVDGTIANKANWYQGISNEIGALGRRFSGQFAGSFGERAATAGWNSILVGDWNNDGQADVAARRSSGRFFFATSNGTPITTPALGANFFTFSTGPLLSPVHYQDFVVADYNNDGLDDIGTRGMNGQQATVSITSFTTTVSFTQSVWGTFRSQTDFFTTTDIDNDGLADLIGIRINDQTAEVLLSQTTTFAANQAYGSIGGVNLLTGPLVGSGGSLN